MELKTGDIVCFEGEVQIYDVVQCFEREGIMPLQFSLLLARGSENHFTKTIHWLDKAQKFMYMGNSVMGCFPLFVWPRIVLIETIEVQHKDMKEIITKLLGDIK